MARTMDVRLSDRELELIANALSAYEDMLRHRSPPELRALLVRMVRAFDTTQGAT